MSLFAITRYQGEDEIPKSSRENQVASILEKLNKSSEKKKKQIRDEIQTKKKCKAKKLKTENNDVPQVRAKKRKATKSESNESETFSESPKKKRKKIEKSRKRKDVSEQDEEPETGQNDTEKKSDSDDVADASDSEDLEEAELCHSSPSGQSSSPQKLGASQEDSGFTVLGQVTETRLEKSQLKFKLPDWMAHPIVITSDLRKGGIALDDVTFLDGDMVEALREDDVKRLFPVQERLIPAILKCCQPDFSTGLLGFRPRDLCCSSPTGSGKTLAFVLPIVQALKPRLVPRIRALVVLPVRDLAKQVYQVFVKLCRKTELKVGLVVGLKSTSQERAMLVRTGDDGVHRSLVDILVATPGRLVDHLQKTPGFDLSRLRFIVIDEADRVMDEIKQDWLHHVTEAINGCHGYNVFSQPLTAANLRNRIIPPQKLLFSATLTQNPEKLQQLNLFQPQLFTSLGRAADNQRSAPELVEHTEGDFIGKYTTPTGLTEYFTECTPQQRPLVLLHYLHNLKFRHVLCFTNSTESTHRLASLVRLFGGIEVREFSSKMDAPKRSKIIREFEAGKIHMIVCSDAMARGMDIDNVKYIISYEPPLKIKTYIHRVGRTARAGRAGTAFSLLERKEVFAFKEMVKSSGKTDVAEQKLRPSMFKNLIPNYEEALEQLPTVLRREKLQKSSQKR